MTGVQTCALPICYATVYERDGGSGKKSSFYVDEHYYLYMQKSNLRDPSKDKIYCQRLGSAEWIQQNVFFYNASLHVRNVSYLWIVKSSDGGRTWSAPIMNNHQVRTGQDRFYGVGPGGGLCMEGGPLNGMMILPTYANPNEHASFIYSRDNGASWTRGPVVGGDATSESCLVQINETTIRHFFRDSWATRGVPIHYVDHTWNGTGWTTGSEILSVEGTTRWGACQLSAIKYSQQIDGKDVILLSAPSSSAGRRNGKIFVLMVNNDPDHTMELAYTHEVNGPDDPYAYSALTETKDGDIALLYEISGTNVPFQIIPFGSIDVTINATGYEGEIGRAHV